jgi:hypothetical protein
MRVTVNRAEFLDVQRHEACAAGRALRDDLLGRYCAKYNKDIPPPPALIVDELLTEFLGVSLEVVPLDLKVFAETEWLPNETIVRVNSLTERIPGVKDPVGVQNVAKWHEGIHVVEHAPGANGQQQLLLDTEPPMLICRRGEPADRSSAQAARELRAEEAGRAAAVSFFHLRRSAAFQELMSRNASQPNGRNWACLYRAAEDIGVNSSALVTQLQLEGYLAIEVVAERRVLRVQPRLGEPT